MISAFFWVKSLFFMVHNPNFYPLVNHVFKLLRSVAMYKWPVTPKKEQSRREWLRTEIIEHVIHDP